MAVDAHEQRAGDAAAAAVQDAQADGSVSTASRYAIPLCSGALSMHVEREGARSLSLKKRH